MHRARPRLRALRRSALVETSHPDLDEARSFAEAIHARFPGKLLAYNCSPSFNWKKQARRRHHRALPARARRDGLQVPVRDARRLPRPEPLHVRARARLRGRAAWRPTAELQQARVRRRGARLHRDPAPARGRHRLLRPRPQRRHRRHGLDGRDGGTPPRPSSSTAPPDRRAPRERGRGGRVASALPPRSALALSPRSFLPAACCSAPAPPIRARRARRAGPPHDRPSRPRLPG